MMHVCCRRCAGELDVSGEAVHEVVTQMLDEPHLADHYYDAFKAVKR